MISFEQEIKQYKLIKDVDQIEEVIREEGTSDLTDLMQSMLKEIKNSDIAGQSGR